MGWGHSEERFHITQHPKNRAMRRILNDGWQRNQKTGNGPQVRVTISVTWICALLLGHLGVCVCGCVRRVRECADDCDPKSLAIWAAVCIKNKAREKREWTV